MRWHILRDHDGLTLARHLPVRFDLSAETYLEAGHPLRLAHQIRQDMWRVLQKLRGFSPVVRLRKVAQGWHVLAGGRLMAAPTAHAQAQLVAVLADPANRARWVRHANRGMR